MFMEPNQRAARGWPFSLCISCSSPAHLSFPFGDESRLQGRAPPPRAPTVSRKVSGFEIKVSCSLNSKENMASGKDVLCKKEEKIVLTPGACATARFWCQLLSSCSQPTSKHEAPSRDTNGFSIKYQILQGGKTGAARLLARTQELIVENRWGAP